MRFHDEADYDSVVGAPSVVDSGDGQHPTMPKPTSSDFAIHVDASCLTDSLHTDDEGHAASFERTASNETVVRHMSWGEENDAQSAKDRTAQLYDKHFEDKMDKQLELLELRIQEAAREVIASIDETGYTPESTELSYQEGTQISATSTDMIDNSDLHTEEEEMSELQDSSILSSEGAPPSEVSLRTEDDAAHHGDVEEDLFSHNSTSARSSFSPAKQMVETCTLDGLDSPVLGEEANTSPLANMANATSHLPLQNILPQTPTKPMRPAFRTPSSVRAIQMSSPTPSIFSSSHSVKRHRAMASRLGTPRSHSQCSSLSPIKRTPTRLKIRKEAPLALLHVTVLPPVWAYSHLMSLPNLPESLLPLRKTWRLIQEKLADLVIDRGVLLAHPQDSYEVMEERLLEALELPVRPRAKILKCGHYLGPDFFSSSDESDVDSGIGSGSIAGKGPRKWCDICRRDVRYEHAEDDLVAGRSRGRLFTLHFYACNGLIRAGAWEACWREMERVDVELEPFVSSDMMQDLEAFTKAAALEPGARDWNHTEHDDGYTNEPEHGYQHDAEQHDQRAGAFAVEELPLPSIEPGKRFDAARQLHDDDEDYHRDFEQARMREVYGVQEPRSPESAQQSGSSRPGSSRRTDYARTASRYVDDSLATLLWRAVTVALQDQRNVVICVLSILVLFFALKPSSAVARAPETLAGIEQQMMATRLHTTSGPVMSTTIESSGISGMSSVSSIIDPCRSVSSQVLEMVRKASSTASAAASTTTPEEVVRKVPDGPELIGAVIGEGKMEDAQKGDQQIEIGESEGSSAPDAL